MYKPKHFKAHELVDPTTYVKWGEKSFMFIDDRLLRVLDHLRGVFGSATINNWKFGGDREWSGFRTPDSKWYIPTSQHSHGRAADVLFSKATVQEVRDYIQSPEFYGMCIGWGFSVTVEEDVKWLHVDVRAGMPDWVNSFNP